MLIIDDFLSAVESDAIIEAISTSGTSWGRSRAGGGVIKARTSSTAWCQERCLQDPTVQEVERRVSRLLGGVPMANAEPMQARACVKAPCMLLPRRNLPHVARLATAQALRYEAGEYYDVHHDQNSPRSSPWGPRMLTVFMYVGEGFTAGETRFPKLNVTVTPKKGRICMWPSVLDSDPYQRDDRTKHESIPVGDGVKYGVNYWIHMFPYRPKVRTGCGNQAYVDNWWYDAPEVVE